MTNLDSIVKKETYCENMVVAHQKRALAKALTGADFLTQRVAEDFALRIASVTREFSHCVDLFSFSNSVTDALEKLDNISAVTRYERAAIAQALDDRFVNSVLPMYADQTHKLFQNVDLLVSAFGLHWMNDILEILSDARVAMKKDGLLLVALPAKGTLFELQDCLTRAELELCEGATSRIDQFVDLQQAGQLLQSAGFKLPVIDQEQVMVRYDDMFALIKDLRAMGATSARNVIDEYMFHPKLFSRANELYLENYCDADGRIRASFNVIYLTAWSPHENQQKPLKPGSANTSLSKFLRSQEREKSVD